MLARNSPTKRHLYALPRPNAQHPLAPTHYRGVVRRPTTTHNHNWTPTEPEVSFHWLATRLRRDQAALASMDVLTFATQKLNFTVEPSQLDFLTSPAKRGIVNCSRRWGKSTLAAIKTIHRALTSPESLSLVVSPTRRQSGLFVAKAKSLLTSSGLIARPRKDPDHELSLRFPNGSLLVGLPAREATIRGFSSVSMLIIDEAARVPDPVYRAVRPMLAVSNGDLWLLSTPMGRRGFFHEECEFGGPRWTRFQVPATACPERISPEFLEEELEAMGPSWVKQEYFCTFVDTGDKVFDQQLIEDAVTPELSPFKFAKLNNFSIK